MVKSGLDSKSVEELGGVPRVSQYRLASHLGMAFCVFALCLRMGLGVKRDWQIVKMGKGLSGIGSVGESLRVLEGRTAGRVRAVVTGMSGLVFLTAFSGKVSLHPFLGGQSKTNLLPFTPSLLFRVLNLFNSS